MKTQLLNDQLRNLYHEHWSNLAQLLPAKRGYSYPLLMHANSGYAFAPVKLFVVGQQAFDWGGTEYGEWGAQTLVSPIDTLMQLYATFNRGENYMQSPFWVAVH